jgi:hypothetical protein
MGGKLRNDLAKRPIRPAHMKLLNERFDDISTDSSGVDNDLPAATAPAPSRGAPRNPKAASRGGPKGSAKAAAAAETELPLSPPRGEHRIFSEKELARECEMSGSISVAWLSRFDVIHSKTPVPKIQARLSRRRCVCLDMTHGQTEQRL